MSSFVERLEQSFGVQFSDSEAEKICTVGQLYDCIRTKLGFESERGAGCVSASLFYRLRSSLTEQFRAQHAEIVPSAGLGQFIPLENRKENWQRFGDSIDLILPRLQRPDWMGAIAMIAIYAFFGSLIAAPILKSWEIFFIGLGIVAVTVALAKATEPFAIHVPGNCRTFRDAIPLIMGMNFARLRYLGLAANQNDLWTALVAFIADEAGVDRKKIRSESSFSYLDLD